MGLDAVEEDIKEAVVAEEVHKQEHQDQMSLEVCSVKAVKVYKIL